MSYWDINWNNLVWWSMPTKLRTSVHHAWLKAVVEPVKSLSVKFQTKRENSIYRLSHNSQVCYMEKVLNDTFDAVDRGIYIADGEFKDPVYVYRDSELLPVWLALDSELGSTDYDSPQWLFTDAETYALGTAFIVYVPMGVIYDVNRMKALINFYRLPGKNYYTIQSY